MYDANIYICHYEHNSLCVRAFYLKWKADCMFMCHIIKSFRILKLPPRIWWYVPFYSFILLQQEPTRLFVFKHLQRPYLGNVINSVCIPIYFADGLFYTAVLTFCLSECVCKLFLMTVGQWLFCSNCCDMKHDMKSCKCLQLIRKTKTWNNWLDQAV